MPDGHLEPRSARLPSMVTIGGAFLASLFGETGSYQNGRAGLITCSPRSGSSASSRCAIFRPLSGTLMLADKSAGATTASDPTRIHSGSTVVTSRSA